MRESAATALVLLLCLGIMQQISAIRPQQPVRALGHTTYAGSGSSPQRWRRQVVRASATVNKDSVAGAKQCEAGTDGSGDSTGRKHFIRNIVEADIAAGKNGGKVITRFPPEPNGYLHIGHAKSICLNFGIAKDYQGQTHMRLDDTNPVKEDIEYVDSILNDVRWLVGDNDVEPWSGAVRHASDYFDLFYDSALYLIEKGLAYVDDLSPEEMREYRGTLTEPGRPSPSRSRTVEENLKLFEEMRSGEAEEGQYVLRAKIDMASPNLNMRDPTIYRVRKATHQMSGDKWCIYPMYDFAHCISDAFEGITHSLCTLEFADHRPLYDWILDQLLPSGLIPCHPQQIEFSRLNLQYTVLSKRKLIQLVEEKHVQGWDDPRMPTISGLRRRGYTPEALRVFCERVGISKAENNIDMSVLEDCARLSLDNTAPRAFAVLDPLKVTITNWGSETDLDSAASMETFEVPVHPKRSDMGVRKLTFGRSLFIDREDFMEVPAQGFKRLTLGGQVRLKNAYVITCDEVVKNDAGDPVELLCSYNVETRAGATPAGMKKVKGIIQWVSEAQAVPTEVRLYDRLFRTASPGKDQPDGDFLLDLNEDSITVLNKCLVEPSVQETMRKVSPGSSCHFQFERLGYFAMDAVDSDSASGRLVMNRVVTLRDSWSDAASAKGGGKSAPTKAKVAKAGGSGSAAGEPSASLDDPRYPFVDDPKAQKGVADSRRVELRVGKILEAEMHPDASTLYVEKIDVGDADGPRTVVSGLAEHIPLDSLVGQMVAVVCNLKPAKMRGIESMGMVLCASNEDDSTVELVNPPDDAEVGERIQVDGEEPPIPDRLLKTDGQQKVWKRLSKVLRSNAALEATVDGNTLTTSAGPCTVPSLAESPIR